MISEGAEAADGEEIKEKRRAKGEHDKERKELTTRGKDWRAKGGNRSAIDSPRMRQGNRAGGRVGVVGRGGTRRVEAMLPPPGCRECKVSARRLAAAALWLRPGTAPTPPFGAGAPRNRGQG
ncbi:hypothetical protein Trydic_g8184 [Trypoxylus dichotomus]